MSVSPSVQMIYPPTITAHNGFRLHILLQFCSSLHVKVAQIGLKCAQPEERRVIRRSSCTVLSRTILNLIYSLNIVEDLGLICLASDGVDLWATVKMVMKLCYPHIAVATLYR